MTETKIFAHAGEGAWTPTPDGNRRRVLLHTDELMMVEFGFDKGGVGALHSHPHVQASYVAEGRFEVTIDGRTEILEAGEQLHRAVQPGAWRQGAGGGAAGRQLYAASRRFPRLMQLLLPVFELKTRASKRRGFVAWALVAPRYSKHHRRI